MKKYRSKPKRNIVRLEGDNKEYIGWAAMTVAQQIEPQLRRGK